MSVRDSRVHNYPILPTPTHTTPNIDIGLLFIGLGEAGDPGVAQTARAIGPGRCVMAPDEADSRAQVRQVLGFTGAQLYIAKLPAIVSVPSIGVAEVTRPRGNLRLPGALF
jgi:hypothetical protein